MICSILLTFLSEKPPRRLDVPAIDVVSILAVGLELDNLLVIVVIPGGKDECRELAVDQLEAFGLRRATPPPASEKPQPSPDTGSVDIFEAVRRRLPRERSRKKKRRR